MNDTVPLIDLSPWFAHEPAGEAQVAQAVARACEDIGFLVISGHQVPQALIDEAFATAAAFFALPAAEKDRSRPADGVSPRGWHALGTKYLARTLGVDTPPDLREQFYIGPLDPAPQRLQRIPAAGTYYQPNIWPEQPAAYRDVFTRYYRVLEALAQELMRIFALALHLDRNYFDTMVDAHFSTLPANLYPQPAGDPLPGQLRAGAHTDFGSLTILALNDAAGGLQVKAADGSWRDVSAERGQLIVNLGDMMQRWTNDRWKSTLHRVVNPPAQERVRSKRMSIGFFLHPNYDARIECLPSCCDPQHPPKYEPIQAGELMRKKMEARAAPERV
jgi:isopenicillin N synthase-like dioxygenase